jgi:hypothetical protein
MSKEKIIKFPISYSQRMKNQMGKGYVPCMVSGRWLQFPDKSSGFFGGGEFIEISVMTEGMGDKPKKICDLIITREDIMSAVNSVNNPEK